MLAIGSLPVQRSALSPQSVPSWIQNRVSRLGSLMGTPVFGVGLTLLALVPLLLI